MLAAGLFARAYAQPNIPSITSDYVVNTYPGGSVLLGSVTDPSYSAIAANTASFRDKSADLLVSLFIDPDVNACYPGYRNIQVNLEVKYVTVNTFGSPSSTVTENIVLEVEKYPNLEVRDKERSWKVYKNAYWSEVRITGVTAVDENGAPVAASLLPDDIKVELELQRTRYYNLNTSQLTTSFVTLTGTEIGLYRDKNNVYVVQWNPLSWASEYELEWIHVDDFAAGGIGGTIAMASLPAKFLNNASRVRVPASQTRFYIPIIYTRGYICARIRPLTKGGPNLDKDLFGDWSFDPNDAGSLFVSNVASAARFRVDMYNTAIQVNNLNSQYSVSFSEEGKILPQGAYADGSLRIRQNNVAATVEAQGINDYSKRGIVTETIYDFLGRPAISTLPGVTELGFWYKANYNQDDLGNKYSYLNFDFEVPVPGTCYTEAQGMGTQRGVSQYYSPSNPEQNAQQARVPDAEKFPFTRIIYEADNASRPKMQSGAGYDFRIGSGHETRYVYGNPSQTDLNRLFGTDAGYAGYYQKSMVIDANGQVSITYTDMAGRTIATSLAGLSPRSLDPLTDENEDPLQDLGEEVTEDLLDLSTQNPHGEQNLLSMDGTSYTVNRFIPVTSEKEYRFAYTLTTEDFSGGCVPDFCADCVYDLEISLLDDCGNYIIGNANADGPYKIRIPGGALNTSCSDSNSFAFDSLVTLNVGLYNVVKRLSIVPEALEAYLDTIMERDTCLKELADFYQVPDLSDCYITCESCLESLGTEADFVTANQAELGGPEQAKQAWLNLKEQCESLCADTYKDECSLGYEMMLQDVSPLGQYCGHSGGDASAFPLSVLNLNNELPRRDISQFSHPFTSGSQAGASVFTSQPSASWKNPRYRNPVTQTWVEGYYDDNGNRVQVVLGTDINGNLSPAPAVGVTPMTDPLTGDLYIYPEQLASTADFINAWRPSFARSLVVYHPEYFKYEFCSEAFGYEVSMNNSSGTPVTVNTYEYANLLQEYNAAQAVAELGLSTPMSSSALINTLIANDPFFSNSGSYAYGNLLNSTPALSVRSMFLDKLNHYQLSLFPVPVDLDIVEMAYVNTHCGIGSASGCVLSAPSTVDLSNPAIEPDQVWRNIAILYATARQQAMASAQRIFQATKRQRIYTDCIGSDQVNFNTLFNGVLFSGVPANPCNFGDFYRFSSMQQRFPTFSSMLGQGGFSDPPTADEMNQYASQAGSTITGKCPMQVDFENMLLMLATHGRFLGSGLTDLSAGGYMGSTLYQYLQTAGNGYNAQVTVSPSLVQVILAGNCTTTLSWPSGAPAGTGWSDISFIGDVHSTSGGPALYAYINNANPTYIEIPFTTCLDLGTCNPDPQAVCKATDDINDLKNLMNMLSADGQLWNTSPFILTTAYEPFLTTNLESILGTGPINTYTWKFTGSPSYTFELKRGTATITLSLDNVSSTLALPPAQPQTFTAFYPTPATTASPSLQSGFSFAAVQSNNATEFYIAPGSPETRLNGTLSTSGTLRDAYASDCDFITDPRCNTQEHKNLRNIEKKLRLAAGSGLITEILAELQPCVTFPATLTNGSPLNPALVTSIQSVEAIMSTSGNGESTNTAVVNVTYSGAPASFIIQSCNLLKNCEPCEGADSCRKNYLEINFKDLIGGGRVPEGVYTITTASEPCNAIPGGTHAFTYSAAAYPSFMDFVTAWAQELNTLYGPGLHAFVLDTRLIIETDVAFLPPPCRCDQFRVTVAVNGRTVTSGTSACCSPYDLPEAQVPQPVKPADGWEVVVQPFSYEVDCYEPTVPTPQDTIVDPCTDYLLGLAAENAWNDYQAYLDSVRNAYRQAYVARCMGALETFEATYTSDEYHFTLFYYDHAGNLVRTVPPKAVTRLPLSDMVAVNSARNAGTEFKPRHNNIAYNTTESYTLTTRYRYDALGNTIKSQTPDGGISSYYYDNLGRIILSKNARQATATYTYTKYDAQGRTVESGVMNRTDALVASLSYLHNPANASTFLTTGFTKAEYMLSFYDAAPVSGYYPSGFFNQNNLRKRVAYTTYYSSSGQAIASTNYVTATYYDYDTHGNVRALLQENKNIASTDPLNFDYNFRYHKVEYVYDLLSGNVRSVSLNASRQDKLIHRYTYDDQNRLLKAMTSSDGYWFDTDAEYDYYYHGPLARVEYGPYKSQGTDYTYTIQGWLKAINSEQLDDAKDPGGDGKVGSPTQYIARDAYGAALTYYPQDYTAISGSQDYLLDVPTSYYSGYGLYNGNIRAMNNTLKQIGDKSKSEALLQVFGYDQLQRIRSSRSYLQYNDAWAITGWNASATQTDMFRTDYGYDANGNITLLNRFDKASVQFDQLTYDHYPNTNRLRSVADGMADGTVTYDVNNQGPVNYTYDATGNLLSDAAEDIASIVWNNINKVRQINRSSSASTYLSFEYDPVGHRVEKYSEVYSAQYGTGLFETEYYVLDARGNPLAIYKKVDLEEYDDPEVEGFFLEEQVMYGNKRLGTIKRHKRLSYTPVSLTAGTQERGAKQYELSNQIGNVQVVVTDRKELKCFGSPSYNYYEPEIRNTYDYYPFGMLMDERCAEKKDSVWVDVTDTLDFVNFENPVIVSSGGVVQTVDGWGRYSLATLSVVTSGGSQMLEVTSSNATHGTHKDFAVTPGQTYTLSMNVDVGTAVSVNIIVWQFVTTSSLNLMTPVPYLNMASNGTYTVTITPTMPNIRIQMRNGTTGTKTFRLDNIFLRTTGEELVSNNDNDYRYGFNGMEKDDELKGQGNSYDYGARIYDPRIAKWLSRDPLAKKYASHSPYNFALNNPIYFKDPDGRDVLPTSQFMEVEQLKSTLAAFSTTEVYKSLSAAFSAGAAENLVFHYRSPKNRDEERAIAGASYGTFGAPGSEKNAHIISVMSLERITLDGEGNMVPGELVYDKGFLAGVLAHEMIHANLDRHFVAKLSIEELEKAYPGINDYITVYGYTENAQHQYMAENSRGTIADAMKQTDISQNTPLREDRWYQAAAWNGLTHDDNGNETEAWAKYKSTASKSEIDYVESVLTSPELRGKAVPK